MWEKGQADPAVHDPTLKNLQGTCERSLPESLCCVLARAEEKSVGGWDNTFGRRCFGFVASLSSVFFVIVATVGVVGLFFCLCWAGHLDEDRIREMGGDEDGNKEGRKKISSR